MKLTLILCLIALVCSQQVLKSNECNDCGLFKSQTDCEGYKAVTCEWIAAVGTTAAKCQKKTGTQQGTFKPYCELVDKPETNCWKTLGCAYLDSKCVHFAGCSAYVKTTVSECQAISYRCVSDGTACIEAQECGKYSQSQCEGTPSISGTFKCKYDTTQSQCRDYACSEAELSLTTDTQCRDWQSTCITRGKGCWSSPLPNCSAYTGTEDDCKAYIGQDGKCELAKDTTNCKARECSGASKSISTDDECKDYQKGCITTGKGCYLGTVKPLCSTYDGDNTSCVGYIGSDGVCEGDAGGSKCRARKCENATFKTDDQCKDYQKSCVTNGVKCVSALQNCNTYKGTATACSNYIGLDGYCTGTSTTVEANCAPKVCDQAGDTLTTDDACEKYQKGCVTTGKGCSTKAALKKCTDYDGDSTAACNPRVGSEGRCTWKTGTKCTARDCASAPSSTNTNPLCANWFTNCVTTGSGCVSATTCEYTVKQTSCEGTKDCNWQPICTSNSLCSRFKKKAICMANTARVADGFTDEAKTIVKWVTKKCGWGSSGCEELQCSHLTGSFYSTHANCQNELSSCISNGVDACITKSRVFEIERNKRHLQRLSRILHKYRCSFRNNGLYLKNNPSCETWNPGCISTGKGCVIYTTTCTQLKGDRDTCNKLYGYSTGSISDYKTVQCYNDSTATADSFCKQKTCTMASGMQEGQCDGFLSGCVFDGQSSCVNQETATCGDYFGVASFCEAVKVKSMPDKYCFGTATAAKCTIRKCEDNQDANTTDEACETFKTGCVSKSGTGCVDKTTINCSSQTGTSDTCPTFSSSTGKCQRYNTCLDRACADLTSAGSHQDCMTYKSTCRFLKSGSACINHNTCDQYAVPDTSATGQVKFDYCTSITDSSGKSCGYKTGNNCAVRTCDQYLSTYTTLALQGTGTCLLAGTGAFICMLCSFKHLAPILMVQQVNDETKVVQSVQKYVDEQKCQMPTWISGTTCTIQSTCEKVITQTDEKTCNDFLYPSGKGVCQKVTDSTCLTTVAVAAGCASYKIDQTKTDAQKKTLCQSLYVIDDSAKHAAGTGVFTKCIYKTGGTCSAISTCAEIPSAVSQADCDKQNSGCFYFSGLCYDAPASCAVAVIPGSATTDTLKSLFCHSMKVGTDYCKLNAAKSACEDNAVTACTSHAITGITGWDGATITVDNYCLAVADKTKKLYCKAGTSPACAAAKCEDIPNPLNQGDCDNRVLGCAFSNGKCRTNDSTEAACTDATVPTDITAASGKTAFCQSITKSSKPCTYDEFKTPTADLKCVATGACSSYATLPTDATAKPTYCLSKVDDKFHKCAFTTGASACRDYDCFDITNATSQLSCDLGVPGKKCTYISGTCYNTTDGCDKIPASGTDKKAYCELLTSNSIKCTYISGANCTPRLADCENYDVTNATNKSTTCNSLKDTSDAECTYIWGNKCVELGACSTYNGASTPELGPETGSEETQCKSLKDATRTYPCIKHKTDAKKCRAQECADNDGDETGCKSNVAGCLYYQTKCIVKTTCASYTVQADLSTTEKKAWCEGVTDTSDNKCKWDGTKCAARTCSDDATAKFYTNYDCKNYLKTCKTNGSKCIDDTSQCNTLTGNQNYCQYLFDNTAKDLCKVNTAAVTSGACQTRTCYDNVASQSDSECDSWMKGCVTRGTGCIPRDRPCSEYRGTKEKCEGFKQFSYYDTTKQIDVYILCSGDAGNTETSSCKERKCSDNIIASSDNDCKAYLDGCVTKGTGCVEKSADCSAYKGNQTTCAKFMGSNGNDYCYNTGAATDTSSCQKKKCTNITGTNNKECSDGMKPFKATDNPFCVYNGTGCESYGKKCSEFKGTEITCQTYIAFDGPCKSTSVGTLVGNCARKVCTEAPNNLKTDKECKDYHPSCYTNGYGCTETQNCDTLINQDSCKARPECTWANFCEPKKTGCSAQSNTSQSNCINTVITVKYCAWTELGKVCRDQKCEDLAASINTHKQCSDFDKTCTTTGAGCITMTTCSGYKTESICKSASYVKDAKTSELGRCGWENNKCRERACQDLSATTDAECDAHLSGCKTNGTVCVSAQTCGDFKTKQYCLSSKTGPCLWVETNSTCYDYDRCEDALFKTHEGCQAFSPLCTTNGEICIPITSCEKTVLKASCNKGTDGDCGYLPTEKCKKFDKCSDAVSSDQNTCLAYGGCITDGATCVAKGKCNEYKTEIACKNNLGTDGICFWNGSACKLKECSDLTGTTHESCKSQVVSSGSCTTDGTKCIPLGLCSSYLEPGCFTGTDGTCIYSYPVGQTTGTKACRLKQCEDIDKGINNSACTNVISGKECVSNTKICIPKAACSTYKTLEACNGGGIDGTNKVVCAFTPNSATDKLNGTCKNFTQCSDANSDSIACGTNKSCKWNQSGTTTSCVSHACDTFATGTDCQPVPSFDAKSFTVCTVQNGKCAPGDPGTMTDPKICYTKSAYTYTWNSATSKCEKCLAGSTQPNNSNNNSSNGNTTNPNTDDFGMILPIITLGLFGIMV
ncbi:unnamed protein product (macronuclear) [Paramecium tetraurelia]|uniref:Uncharacterized protein n=1 Tax=Paramecium tetraurelia TaxID=5888 RepID=A0CAA6_PARTE|nr:uncharacterized protein GSPATT00036503001 [Paramecium tetraurelia]CAK67723.1 unnamed protein product [Paramecium tetraurelia]|eukprot:XP_001435120.1 hypothetical protein (macronuclear) [Paramecium tetraurelia strain d4-2]